MVDGKVDSRKKPRFLTNDWHKKIKLGSTVKKNRKWRGAKGRQNKIRLGRKGHPRRPKIGWSVGEKTEIQMVKNLKELEGLKGEILIGSVGKKKRDEIIAKAKEMKLKVMNKYLVKKNESK